MISVALDIGTMRMVLSEWHFLRIEAFGLMRETFELSVETPTFEFVSLGRLIGMRILRTW
jgi:hypothetical protein